jgi:hypothetical protein
MEYQIGSPLPGHAPAGERPLPQPNFQTSGYSTIPKPGVTAYDLKALVGIINSKALRFFYRTTFKTLHVQNKELASLPLPTLNLKKKEGKAAHDRLVTMVEQMLQAEDQLSNATTDADSTYLEGRIRTLDQRIDDLICALYGLNATDAKVIEAALGNATG